MNGKHPTGSRSEVSRRTFLKSAAAAGAGLALVAPRIVSAENLGTETVNVGIIGAGNEARVLVITNSIKIPGVRFRAIADIWPWNRGRMARLLKKFKHETNEYTDYQEMLAKEKDLDAVIIASPDCVHAEHSIASLKAGLHVYCEKEMSNTIEKARQMVLTAKQTGKLLQIGHQRRSNPRYHMALDYINRVKAIGRMTNVMGNWNRAKPLHIDKWSDKAVLPKAVLEKYGYGTMERFRNWRWYKQFSGGPIADLGSHQIDIFCWFLNAMPKSVIASGGTDNYPKMEWYDNVLAVYEWDYKFGGETRSVRGHYQLFSTTSHGGYQETFMGNEGSLVISEGAGIGGLRREYSAEMADWEYELQKAVAARATSAADLKKEVMALRTEVEGLRKAAGQTVEQEKGEKEEEIKIGHSVPAPGRYYPPIPAPLPAKPEHMPHLENFFDAVRGKAKLNCPGEIGYETAVAVLRVNDAIATGKKIEFKPEDFHA